MSWFIEPSLNCLRNSYSSWRVPPAHRSMMAWYDTHTHTHCACSVVLKQDRMSLSNLLGVEGKKIQIISHRGEDGVERSKENFCLQTEKEESL